MEKQFTREAFKKVVNEKAPDLDDNAIELAFAMIDNLAEQPIETAIRTVFNGQIKSEIIEEITQGLKE